MKSQKKQLLEKDIPTTMFSLGISSYEGLDGLKVSYEPKYRGSKAEDRVPGIVQLLGKYNMASGFKKSIVVTLPLEPNGDLPYVLDDVIKAIVSLGVMYDEKFDIHAKTLEKVVNDLMSVVSEEDKPQAVELLKIDEYFSTKIKG